MKYVKSSRRHFLQGLGGTLLALPFMPSLMHSARAAYYPGPKYFVGLSTFHGGILEENFYPQSAASVPTQIYDNHTIYSGSLSDFVSNRTLQPSDRNSSDPVINTASNNELSPVLGDFLNPYLHKMNVLRGLDMMFYGGHHRGQLGAFHHADEEVEPWVLPPMPSIDQRMAESSQFYGESSTHTLKTVALAPSAHFSISHGFSNGSVAPLEPYNRVQSLFDDLFGGGSSQQSPDYSQQISILDTVLEDYQRVYNSSFGAGRRISAEDRVRLDEHLTEVRELEQRLQNYTNACALIERPASNQAVFYPQLVSHFEGVHGLWVDIVCAAFKCGLTRICTSNSNAVWEYGGDWHQDVAHNQLVDVPFQQYQLVNANRRYMQLVFARFLENLDVPVLPNDSTTYLDNSLIYFTQECGYKTHDNMSQPCITAGSAGGFFKTNMYVDYRNRTHRGAFRWSSNIGVPGLPQNRWLYTALESMGVQKNEYASGAWAGMVGYGDPKTFLDNLDEAYPQEVRNDMGNLLPLIVA